MKAIYALLVDDIEQEGRIDFQHYNKELAEAEAEYTNGKYICNTSMKKKIKQLENISWFGQGNLNSI